MNRNPLRARTIALVSLALTTGIFLATSARTELSDDNWSGVGMAKDTLNLTTQNALNDFSDGACRIGSLRSDRVRTGSLFEFKSGTAYGDARVELGDPSQFGPGGIVNVAFQLLPAVFDISEGNLANADVFWAALLDNGAPLSAVEQQALLDFVEAGRALVVTGDVGAISSIGANSVGAPFGVVWDNFSFLNQDPTITDPSHAIIDGPFGTVSNIAHASEGSIADLGTLAV